jgi:CheY-like chemotaxis protein
MVDLSLPDMTGWEVLKGMREEEDLAQVPVLVVSANAHEYAPGSAQALHDGFVMKPVDAAVLFEALRARLQLEWTYAHEPATVDAQPAVSAELRGRIGQHLEELWQLGLIGHVRGIHSRLREFETTEPGAAPLVRALRGMVERFDMKRYMQAIGELRESA